MPSRSPSSIVIGRLNAAQARSGRVGYIGAASNAISPDEIIVPANPTVIVARPDRDPYAQRNVDAQVVISSLRAVATVKIVGTALGAGAGYFLGSKKHETWKNVAAGAALGNIISGFGGPIVGTALFAGLGAGIAYLTGRKPMTGALAGAGASALASTVVSAVVIGASPTVVTQVSGFERSAGLGPLKD